MMHGHQSFHIHPVRNLIQHFLMVCCIVLFLSFSAVAVVTENREREDLLKIYNSLGGENWLWKDPLAGQITRQNKWFDGDDDDDICRWMYIGCHKEGSDLNLRIKFINIVAQNLVGTIPTEVFNFPYMETITISNNTGVIGKLPEPPASSSSNYKNYLLNIDFGYNSLTGTIPSSYFNISHNEAIFLLSNYFSGSIPELTRDIHLKLLWLSNNFLTGTLPSSLYHMTNLRELYVQYNNLNGTLPDYFGNMKKLQVLYLDWNYFTGTLPANIFTCHPYDQLQCGLLSFNARWNYLSGSIPSGICDALDLGALDLQFNNMTGTLPQCLGDKLSLNAISLQNNAFSGTLPPFSSNKTWSIYAHHNKLTGTIPSSLTKCTDLGRLDLGYNHLSSTIPEELSTFPRLSLLDLSNNLLTGTIPNGLGRLPCLLDLTLSSNQLTGIIPNFAQINQSSVNDCYDVLVTEYQGNLEDCLGSEKCTEYKTYGIDPIVSNAIQWTSSLNYTGVFKIDLANNSLHGDLLNIRNLTSLYSLSLGQNRFTSTIPSFLRNMTSLNSTDLSQNFLTGTIPSDLFVDMVNLSTLLLYSNDFVGKIPDMIPNNVSIYNVGDNNFIGKIPENIFRLPLLSEFAASKNCISLTLPSSICEAGSLRYLYLSGLQQSPKCSKATLEKREEFDDSFSIPSCMWSDLDLIELKIAGNSYSGNLESFNMPNISKLDVRYNRLHGTVPAAAFNKKRMNEFLVSHNMFTGTLEFSVEPTVTGNGQTYFKADVNRISGPLDTNSLNRFWDVAVLNGNTISCSTIPSVSVDPGASSYVCGSKNFELSVYLWLSSFGMFALVATFCYFSKDPRVRAVHDRWKEIYTITDLISTDAMKHNFAFTLQMLTSLEKLRTASILISVLCVLTTVTIYSIFKYGPNQAYFRTHYYQYLYAMSGVFLKSPTAAGVLMVVHSIFAFLTIYVFYRFFIYDWSTMRFQELREERKKARILLSSPQDSSNPLVLSDASQESSLSRLTIASPHQDFWRYIAKMLYVASCCILFLMVALGGNSTYILFYPLLNSTELIFVQFAILGFNGILKSFCIPSLIDYLFNVKDRRQHSGTAAFVMAFLLGCMEIVIPFLACVISDESCFYSAINGNESIEIQQTTSGCYQFASSVYNGSDINFFDADIVIGSKSQTVVIHNESDTHTGRNASHMLYGHHLYCTSEYTTQSSYKVQPDFVYSGQCRNALIRNFLPLTMIQAAFDAFIIPLVYYFLMSSVKSFNDSLDLFGGRLRFTNIKKLIIVTPIFSVIKIWQTVVMQLTFGLFSPIASIALGLCIVSRITLFLVRICHYFRTLKNTIERTDDKFTLKHSEWDLNHPDNIEYIMTNVSSLIHAILWPGLILSTLLFSLYVLDMSLDMNEPSFPVSISLTVITSLSIPVYLLAYYRRRDDLLNTVRNTRAAIENSTKSTELTGAVRNNSNADGDSTMNPVLGEKDFRYDFNNDNDCNNNGDSGDNKR